MKRLFRSIAVLLSLLNVTADGQECRYLNSRGDTVPVVNPFAEISCDDTLRFPLNL